ncbi:hypothetical protein WMY93_000065 [Mugilogobius chulae]|uniref:protein-tyrosine-phosphatase n=1 Tax=Mugilogobius chulae TaxID=88201 RepID=A0AAW0Q8Z5_9GOBI
MEIDPITFLPGPSLSPALPEAKARQQGSKRGKERGEEERKEGGMTEIEETSESSCLWGQDGCASGALQKTMIPKMRKDPKPMHGPRKLEVVEVQSRQVTIRWEPVGYNVTRCHTGGKEEAREEMCYDTQSRNPQHTIHNLTPFTNLSVKLVLSNSEGVKESAELEVQTDEDARGTAEILRCYPVPIHFSNATALNSQYYFTAQFPAGGIHAPQPFTVGDNKTYNGYWNAPLLPQKSYSIYYQAVSTANGETKIDCVRVATKAAILVTQLTTPYLRIAPAAGDSQLTAAGSSPSSFTLPKANTLSSSMPSGSYYQVKKNKKHYVSVFIYEHLYPFVPTAILVPINDESQNMGSDTSSLVQSHSHSLRKRDQADVPYQTGQLHPAIRVADLLQHITQMKCSEGYGFKEEYEINESFFEGQSAAWDSAKKDENRMKNRYGNIIAYDHSRVRLQAPEGEQGSDYINANYVDGYHRPNHYIATQGPMQETVFDFWRMVWQENTAAIVMVTNLVEVGRVSANNTSALAPHLSPDQSCHSR